MLLVGLLFFVVAVLAVLGIWLWQELENDKQQSQRPQRQPPKIVIRPKPFRTKRIVVQPAVTPTAIPRPPSPPPVPPRPVPSSPPVPPRPVPSPPPVPPRPAPPVSRTTTPVAPPPRVTPPPPPPPVARAPRTVQQPIPEPVMAVPNGPSIRATRFKVDFDTFCRRTGQRVRTCSCQQCREMRANAGI